jgi:hypothetical protein
MTGKRPVRHRRGPPGTPHRFWNDTDEEARVLVELRPALNSEIFFETLYGLPRDGKTDENGVPNLLQQAVTLNGINKGGIYLAQPPIPVQKAFLAALAPVGENARVQRPLPEVQHSSGDSERRGS